MGSTKPHQGREEERKEESMNERKKEKKGINKLIDLSAPRFRLPMFSHYLMFDTIAFSSVLKAELGFVLYIQLGET